MIDLEIVWQLEEIVGKKTKKKKEQNLVKKQKIKGENMEKNRTQEK